MALRATGAALLCGGMLIGEAGAAAGTFTVSSDVRTYSENTSTIGIAVFRDNGAQGEVGVSYSTQNGSAMAGSDYTSSSGTLTWAHGDDDAQFIEIPVSDDSAVESAETFTLNLSNPTGGANLQTATVNITLLDNDGSGPGKLRFAVSIPDAPLDFVFESDPSTLIYVERVEGKGGAVSATVVSSDGTATANLDYLPVNQQLNWANGETGFKFFFFAPIDDEAAEAFVETARLTLTAPTGATLGTPSFGDVEILSEEIRRNSGGGALPAGALLALALGAALARRRRPRD